MTAYVFIQTEAFSEPEADIVEPIRRLPGVTRAIVAPRDDHRTGQPELSQDEAA